MREGKCGSVYVFSVVWLDLLYERERALPSGTWCPTQCLQSSVSIFTFLFLFYYSLDIWQCKMHISAEERLNLCSDIRLPWWWLITSLHCPPTVTVGNCSTTLHLSNWCSHRYWGFRCVLSKLNTNQHEMCIKWLSVFLTVFLFLTARRKKHKVSQKT